MSELAYLSKTYSAARSSALRSYSAIPEGFRKTCPHSGNAQLNSAYWILGHLFSSQCFIVFSLSKTPIPEEFSWLKLFGNGSDPETANSEGPDEAVILAAMEKIHPLALKRILELTEEELNFSTGIPPFPTLRDALYYLCQHESVHNGHLGWLKKIADFS